VGKKKPPQANPTTRYGTRSQFYSDLENDWMNNQKQQKAKDDSTFDDLWGRYSNFADTGGWSPERIASIDDNIRGFKDFGRTGGLDEESIRRFRGGGVFDDLIKTGGYSEGDLANIRGRAASNVPSFYENLKNNLSTQNNAQGGYSPGYSYQNAKLARDASRETSNSIRDSEIGIADSVRSGRLAGATGMSGAENSLQSLRTRNMLAGLGGANDAEMGLMSSINSGKLAGLGGLRGLRTDETQSERQMRDLLQLFGLNDQNAANYFGNENQKKPSAWWNLLALIPAAYDAYKNRARGGFGGGFGGPRTYPDWTGGGY